LEKAFFFACVRPNVCRKTLFPRTKAILKRVRTIIDELSTAIRPSLPETLYTHSIPLRQFPGNVKIPTICVVF
jgi:hypothetical protein